MSEQLLAGWGEADTTPDSEDIELAGQYYQRLARGIHSRLKAVALVIEQADKRTVMVSLDVAGVPEEFCLYMQNIISAKMPNIPANRIIFSATHTHTAPDIRIRKDWRKSGLEPKAIEEFRDLVEAKVLKSVEQAWSSRQPAGVSNVLDFARLGHCRRAVYSDDTAEMYGRTDRDDFVGMEGGEDSGVDLFFFFDRECKPTGVIVNVACPSQVMEATYQISSDYMGTLREKLKQEFGDDFRTLTQVSAAGCQSPRDLSRSYKGEADFWHEDGLELASDRLLDAVKRGYSKAAGNIVYAAELRHATEKIELPRRRASYSDYIKAKSNIGRLSAIWDTEDAFKDFCDEVHKNERIAGRPGPYDSKLHDFVKTKNSEAVVRRYEDQEEQPNFAVELHVVRIGDVVFATNPFELFLVFGHQIKARSRARQTFLIQLANGIGGYLPSERAERLGGYGGLIINGQVGSDGGKKLADETVSAIERLYT